MRNEKWGMRNLEWGMTNESSEFWVLSYELPDGGEADARLR